MSYYTSRELRAWGNNVDESTARDSLRLSSKGAVGSYDVFLSHSYVDASVILGIYRLFTTMRFRVYVDWISDHEIDRKNVSAATANRLRCVMRSSSSLVYATSRAARKSRWMPWELGYFDGLQGSGHIGVLPIENGGDRPFDGQEYLGLYKVIEKRSLDGLSQPVAVPPSGSGGESLRSFANLGRRLYS